MASLTPSPAKQENSVRGLWVSNADATLIECALCLVKLLETSQDIPILAPMMLRELYYRLLLGEQSEAVRQIATSDSSMQHIASAIQLIQAEFSQLMRSEDGSKTSQDVYFVVSSAF